MVFLLRFLREEIDFTEDFGTGRAAIDEVSEEMSLRRSSVSIELVIEEVSLDRYFL